MEVTEHELQALLIALCFGYKILKDLLDIRFGRK